MGNGTLHRGCASRSLVTYGFVQVELEKPRAALDDRADTFVVSPKDKTVLGMNHLYKRDEFIVDQQMEHAECDDFNAGSNWTDQETVLDKNRVSSRQPDDISAFNRAMLELFAGIQKKSE